MLSRNIAIRDCLQLAICDNRCDASLKKYLKIKTWILDEAFWSRTMLARDLLVPLKNAINEVESDNCHVSVIPTIWHYICHATNSVLDEKGNLINDEEKDMVLEALSDQRDFSVSKIHLAANVLDPRFNGRHLSEEDTTKAENVIMKIAADRTFPMNEMANDLMQFKAKDGNVFGRPHIWNCAASLETDPLTWWKVNGGTRYLSCAALVILSFPCSIASVERANKEYSLQKTLKRN